VLTAAISAGNHPETHLTHTRSVRDSPGALAGYTVGVTADRRSDEQIKLLERRGARVLHGPTIRTLPLHDDDEWFAATRELIADPPDLVVLTTAIGVRSWLGAAESRGIGEPLLDALRTGVVVTRGPKAMGAAVTIGLDVSWSSPAARSSEVLDHVIDAAPPGHRIAVQLDGGTNGYLADALATAGFDVVPIRIYEWTEPADAGPALRLIAAVGDGSIDAVTFTAAPALRNFLQLAEREGRTRDVHDAFASKAVDLVLIGPACADEAESAGLVDAVVPATSRLGAMVQAYVAAVADRSCRLQLAGIAVELQGRLVSIDGRGEVHLSDRERGVLEALARRPGAVVSKATLVREVWANQGDEHIAEVTVARLRQRLGDAGAGIETVVRRGYRLCAEAS
jgi:uroporphyrinogen-III synthase